ncbi:MAG: RNA polymerase sigma factor [Solirubrobacterales bacterium]
MDSGATDAELVARCRDGEQRAWDELVERFAGYIYAILARGYRMPDHEAEDLFQEVFARLYERIDSLRDDEAIRAWIGQTTRRLAIDAYRANQKEGASTRSSLPDLGELDARIEQLAEALDVRRALSALPERCGEILTRFFIRDQSYRAIGEALQLPPGTIASRISRCLERLRKEMLPSDV